MLKRRLDFINSVITRAELRHQRYIIKNSRAGTTWIVLAVLMLAPGIIASFVSVGLVLLGVDVSAWPGWSNPIVNTLVSSGVISLFVMNFALYLVLMLITLGLAYSSINREKVNRTWDVLLLTNVDARQVVRGKWWASLASLWGDHMILVVLRVGLAAYLILNSTVDNGTLYLLLMTLAMVAFTLVDAAFTVALGIVSALSGMAAPISGTVVLVLRILGVMAATIFYMLALYLVTVGAMQPVLMLIGIMLGTFSLFTWLTLALGRVLAVRGLVSPAGAAA